MKSPVSGSIMGGGPFSLGGKKVKRSGFLSFYLNDSKLSSGEVWCVGEILYGDFCGDVGIGF